VVEEDAAGGETTTHAYGKDEMVEEVKAVAEAEAVGTSVAKARMEGAEEVVAEAITVDAEALQSIQSPRRKRQMPWYISCGD
jgi:hypothetical protein